MNKKVLHLVYGCFSLLLAMAFASCTQEENLEAPSGLRIALKEFQQDVHARTIPADLEKPLAEKFDLKVKESVSGRLVHEGKVNNELIPLSTGTYEVTASYGKKNVLAIDAPAYEGTSSVTLKTNEEKTVNLTCGVANALLSVKITNPALLEEQYSEYKVGVRVNNNAIKIGDFKKSIYFPAGSAFSIFLEGRKKTDGSLINNDLKHESIPATCKAGDHIILTLTVSNAALDVSKVEVRQEEISATIPMEWLPKPRIQAEAGFLDNALTLTETETKEARLKFLTASPLQDVKLKFHFGDEALAAYNDTEYLLSNPEHKTQLEALGMVLPEIGAATSAIDFKALTAKLQTNAGATTTNTVEIDVKANNRWSSENKEANRTYTFNCNKPEFNVTVLPGDIWTKEFTVSPLQANEVTGDLDKLTSKIVYQYSDNQSTWKNLDSQYTQTGLQPEKVYYVRAQFRGVINSDVVEVKMNPEDRSLDTGLETWSYEQLFDKGIFGSTNYYPWKRWFLNSDKKDTVEGWCSLNSLTTRDNSSLAYRSNSGTEPTSDKHGGSNAAEIKTIGWGSGNTAASPISVINQVTPGELFLGKMASGNNAEYGYHNFVTKPTGVRFFYKYNPKGPHQFTVEIALYAGQERIAYNTFNGGAQGSYIEHVLPFEYDELQKHLIVDCIHIRFTSGENSKAEVDVASIKPSSRHTGNVLYVDDISLVYDK